MKSRRNVSIWLVMKTHIIIIRNYFSRAKLIENTNFTQRMGNSCITSLSTFWKTLILMP